MKQNMNKLIILDTYLKLNSPDSKRFYHSINHDNKLDFNTLIKYVKNNNINKSLIRNYSNFNITEKIIEGLVKKQKWLSEVFSFSEFSDSSFIEFLIKNLKQKRTYSILFKLGFAGNIFFMTGRQIGILVGDKHNIDYYNRIYEILQERITQIMENYDLDNAPINISILYKIIETDPLLKQEKLNIMRKLEGINPSIFKPSSLKNISKYLPLSMYLSDSGNLLQSFVRNSYIKKLKENILTLSGSSLPEVILKAEQDETIKILLKRSGKTDKYIIFVENISSTLESTYKKSIYDVSSGLLLEEVYDTLLEVLSIENLTYFKRRIKNITITIQNGVVILLEKKINFDSIKNNMFISNSSSLSSRKFGVLDVETYKDKIGKVYALGYATPDELSNKELDINTFYLTDYDISLDSNKLVVKCIDSMLIPKYHNYIFYVHNLGKFDVVFIQKALEEYNLYRKEIYKETEDYYKLNSLFRDDKMLRLSVSLKLSPKKYIKINFVDSLNLLNSSLESLCKDFQVNRLKGKFPYNFVSKDTLNYIGNTPDISYYNNISEEEYYSLINTENWDLKEESIKYLRNDLSCLLEVLKNFNSLLFKEHDLQMTEGLTISRIALNKFMRFYLNDSKIPLINKSQYFNFIYFGYYGGITEVYKPHAIAKKNNKIKYYDVNSLYPYVALQDMPGTECTYIENISNENLDIINYFGFFQAKVKTTNNSYLGLLPVKTKLGLIFPNGEFEGVWSSEELKFAKENGYDIKIIKGYNFNKVSSPFINYIKDLYELKCSSTGALKQINKSLLNNLLGRFGMNIIKPKTEIVNFEKLDLILSTREVKSHHELPGEKYQVTFIPVVKEDICNEHGLDYVKVLTKDKNYEIEKNIDVFKDVSIVISGLVTSYARIYMNKIKLLLLKNGGNIYYSDTDSLVTDIDLSLIDSNLVGKGLGQFKLEYLIDEAYFISNKTYCLVLDNGKIITKTKGCLNTSLSLEDFKTMYYNTINVTGTKTQSTKNYKEGSVLIDKKEINLNWDAYKKREKLYDNNGLWVDTKPLTFNNIIKEIVPVINKKK